LTDRGGGFDERGESRSCRAVTPPVEQQPGLVTVEVPGEDRPELFLSVNRPW
jgi:hypothetical protein